MERLPKRLKAVVSLIPPGKRVADIGTDHALLPIYLVKSGRDLGVIASEINQGPFLRAKENVRLQGLEEAIDVRLGNGLEILKPGEAEVIVISGLGGYTIVDIFNASSQVLEQVESLVLSPASHEAEVRRWLKDNGWQLNNEELVKDQGRIYQIIQAELMGLEPGLQGSQPVTELEYDVGPINLRKKHPLLKEYLLKKLKKYETAKKNLGLSQSIQSQEKAEKLRISIEEIRNQLAVLGSIQEDTQEGVHGNMQKCH